MYKGICFYDFDGTITCCDTFPKFAFFSIGLRKTIIAFIKSLPMIILWKLGITTNSKAKEALFGNLYKGMSYSEFSQRGLDFAVEIDKYLRKDIMESIRTHKKEGRNIVIVSASIKEWITPWAEKHGIECVIATEVEVDHLTNCLTGRFSTPNCVGTEKVVRIKKAFATLDNVETWAYGDSKSDEPMFQISDNFSRV